jgi:ubiquinone/menaquinone biosynthesis C-methylase UbiE
MTTQDQDQTRGAWEKIAAGFDEFATPLTIHLSEEALRKVGLRSGMRFLDVAAGSGALSIPAARLGAQVLATDLAPTMIELLNERAREEGLSNLEGRVMDGQALDLEDDTFDISGSQNGVSLFPDLKRGLRELVRVTKPGGAGADRCVRPTREGGVPRLLPGGATRCHPRLHGPADGPATSAVPGGGP